MMHVLKLARLIGSRGPIIIAAILLAVAYSYTVNDFWVSHVAGRTLGLGTIALSLVFLSAYTGMLSLAQMTVAGVAGYALAHTLAPIAGFAPLPWAMAVAIALGCAVAAGTLIGLVAVRTEGVATLMITLAIAMAFYYLTLQNYALFNGYDGFTSVRAPEVLGIALDKPRPLYFLSLLVATGCYLGVRWLSTAPLGLALQAMRDNPRRLRALGYPVGVLRVIAFAIAGLVAGLGGLLNVWHNGSISPGSVGINAIMDVLVVAVLGGLRHPIGAFVGALAFSVIQSFAIVVVGPERFNTAIGMAFIAVVVFSPDGIVGLMGEIRRRFWALVEDTAARWPMRIRVQQFAKRGDRP
jgi:branched-chain amino acid transport system permease protein